MGKRIHEIFGTISLLNLCTNRSTVNRCNFLKCMILSLAYGGSSAVLCDAPAIIQTTLFLQRYQETWIDVICFPKHGYGSSDVAFNYKASKQIPACALNSREVFSVVRTSSVIELGCFCCFWFKLQELIIWCIKSYNVVLSSKWIGRMLEITPKNICCANCPGSGSIFPRGAASSGWHSLITSLLHYKRVI